MHSTEQDLKPAPGASTPAQPEKMDTDQPGLGVSEKTISAPRIQIDDRTVSATGKWIKIAAVVDEELVEGETVADPELFVQRLKSSGLKADVFTFAQKLPGVSPRYTYQLEWDNQAVISITSFSDWWERRVEPSVRRAVRKATKVGVTTKLVQFDDAFVKGIVDIYNESPIRQGRAFWHYQKDFDTVRRENSTYLESSAFIGAYYGDELIGFVRMVYVDKVANIIQVLSKMKHFDKRPTNAMIAKAVEICEERGLSHLVYCAYVYNDPKSSLTEFKRRNGFEQVLVPRYYIPLTLKGRSALKLKLHRGFVERLPRPLVSQLLKIRSLWYGHKVQDAKETP